ncbi:hypothetical protein V5O48_014562, partial [Marasmius crinis-equi]
KLYGRHYREYERKRHGGSQSSQRCCFRIYNLASEVLLVSEKLLEVGDRRYWAEWADSDADGGAIAEQFDEALEKGEAVGFFKQARRAKKEKPEVGEETRKRKREVDDVDGDSSSSASPPIIPQSPSSSQDEDPGDEDEIRGLLAEALLTLAILTKDEKRREELYARAEKESRGGLQLGAEEERMES